ncbi:MAG: DUF58 domain-containing protein [Cellvibrionaceae bacterium]
MLSWTWKKTFHAWLKRRIPRQKSHHLQHRNIFILPSKVGLSFVVLIVLLWLLGTNYQNNLVLSVAFLLLALIVVCIHHTYGNLSGLDIRVLKTHSGFVGDNGTVDLLVKKEGQRDYDSISLGWPDGNVVTVALINQSQSTVSLLVPIKYRGWFQPERLRVSTRFPLGLIVAWSSLDLDASILAYPKPVPSSIQPTEQLLDDSDDIQSRSLVVGHEEFAGIRAYEAGDSLRNIDWRALARGQGLATRTYEDYVNQHYWLDWQQFDGLSREERLSRLCACVLDQETLSNKYGSNEYGLRLPGKIIEPSQGESHQQTLLKALALFEWENDRGDIT